MVRSELVHKLADRNPDLDLRDIDKIVAVFFETISGALVRNQRVELRGFGAFRTRSRNARLGRNPRTGASVKVGSKRVPHFKSGKRLAMDVRGEGS